MAEDADLLSETFDEDDNYSRFQLLRIDLFTLVSRQFIMTMLSSRYSVVPMDRKKTPR